MEVSDKLAVEFNTIILSHSIALLILFSFSVYFYFHAKKSALLYSYLSVVGMIAIWMISKIFKTVSPTIDMRWAFIVTQYFAVDFLGVCLLLFAYVYSKNRLPSIKLFLIWLALPAVSFLMLVTNPLHMMFYSHFDIYRDSFGSLFYFAQSVQYLYMIIAAVLLSRGFTKQPGFLGKRSLGKLFSVFVLLPLLANIYYILFKMELLPWIFPFSIFDFSPIAGSISLILFMIPALKIRFFDMSPVSLVKLYELVPQGIVFADKKMRLYGGNQAFFSMLSLDDKESPQEHLDSSNALGESGVLSFRAFVGDKSRNETEICLTDGRLVRISKSGTRNGHMMLCLIDITENNRNKTLLSKQNMELERVNSLLDNMAENARELAVARTKAQMAQNVHDILGHSLTVVIGTAELASENTREEAKQKFSQIEELLTGSLNELRGTFSGDGLKWGQTSLTKAVGCLKNDSIDVDIKIQGTAYELNSEQTEAIYRLCQEAVTNAIKHGKAKNIYIILRYNPLDVEAFAVDNGVGSKNIIKNFGLSGIEKRFSELSGSVCFSSDGESGFTVYAKMPK